MPNYPQLCLIIHARDNILHTQQRIIITKAQVKLQADWLNMFGEEMIKVHARENIFTN